MITLEDIKTLISEEVQKLNQIGIYPVSVNKVELVKAKSFYADAWRGLNKIRVSVYYLSANIEEVRATIMHELCHMVPESGRGHGKGWQAIAAQVNRNYPQYNIKRVGSQLAGSVKSFSLRAAASIAEGGSKPVRHHIVKCTACGRTWTRSRESNLTLHPEHYHCTCGGSLIRVC